MPGTRRSATSPKQAPAVEPMNNAGENTPPEAPEPSESAVASSFSPASSSRNHGSASAPVSTSMTVA